MSNSIHKATIAIVLLFIGSAVGVAALWIFQRNEIFIEPGVINSKEIAVSPGASLNQGPSSKLSNVFKYEMLGAEVSYLESITGPAIRLGEFAGNGGRLYKVDGCSVGVTTSGSSITSLRLEINKNCTFDLRSFLGLNWPKLPTVNEMTFDSLFHGRPIHFFAPCLDCGNSADPTIFAYWEGGRADRDLKVALEGVLASDMNISMANIWEAAMKKAERSDYIESGQFNCTDKYDEIARNAMKDMKISAITIGDIDASFAGKAITSVLQLCPKNGPKVPIAHF